MFLNHIAIKSELKIAEVTGEEKTSLRQNWENLEKNQYHKGTHFRLGDTGECV